MGTARSRLRDYSLEMTSTNPSWVSSFSWKGVQTILPSVGSSVWKVWCQLSSIAQCNNRLGRNSKQCSPLSYWVPYPGIDTKQMTKNTSEVAQDAKITRYQAAKGYCWGLRSEREANDALLKGFVTSGIMFQKKLPGARKYIAGWYDCGPQNCALEAKNRLSADYISGFFGRDWWTGAEP